MLNFKKSTAFFLKPVDFLYTFLHFLINVFKFIKIIYLDYNDIIDLSFFN